MRKEVVLDVETKKIFSEVEKNNPRLLEISFVGIYQYETDSYRGFWEDELDQLWPVLESADGVIGFNILKFDYAVLAPYYAGDLYKISTLDLLDEVKNALGFRISLDNLSRATLNLEKSGNGLAAVELFHTGQKEKLAEYCLNDVKITRELYEYALSHQSLKYYDLTQIREFPLKISSPQPPQDSKLQMSLGV